MQIQKQNINASNISPKNFKVINGMIDFYISNVMSNISHEPQMFTYPKLWNNKESNNDIVSKSQYLNIFTNNSTSKSFRKTYMSTIDKSNTVSLPKRNNTLNRPIKLEKNALYSHRTPLQKKIISVNNFCLKEEIKNLNCYKSLFNKVNEGFFWFNKVNNKSYKTKQVYNFYRNDLQRITKSMITRKNHN